MDSRHGADIVVDFTQPEMMQLLALLGHLPGRGWLLYYLLGSCWLDEFGFAMFALLGDIYAVV